MEFGKSCWYTFEQGSDREWLIGNGIGGYASLSLIASNTRRYHGLLISALKPPTSRFFVLSNVLEDISFSSGETVTLSSFKTVDGYVNKGYECLQRVIYDYLPQFIYSYHDLQIKKKIAMKYGENTTVIQYDISNGSQEAILKLTPLVNFRDHHYRSESSNLKFRTTGYERAVTIIPENSEVEIKLGTSEGNFEPLNNCYFYNMFYPKEQERGLDSSEDHSMPGFFQITLKPWEHKKISFFVTTEKYQVSDIDAFRIIIEEEDRLKGLLNQSNCKNELCRRLTLTADTFIVQRKSTGSKTIIAGYPWFTDWGRDTMIALPGLALATGRFDDAKDILRTFSEYENYGLLPNMFPDDGLEPLYNSVDAALWYFEAVSSYLHYTGNFDFVRRKIYCCMKKICSSFIQGTIFDIRMTEDGLITAGNERTQLTWMDAKVGDWVVTPRHGKAVEINALWYNALRVMSALAKRFGETDNYMDLAEKVKISFERTFWNQEKNCLYDVVNTSGKDASVRPNQILAVGLTHAVMEGDKARAVVETVWKELYSTYGLRTLAKGDMQYRGECTGDSCSRDGAYHQGTVWTWPLGRFVKAYVRVHGDTEEARKKAADFLAPFMDHLKEAGIGSISEIFDGDNPHYPRGCFSQAWSVCEILRAAAEDVTMEGDFA